MHAPQRRQVADVFGSIEHAFYFAIAVALAIAGAVLFVAVAWDLAVGVRQGVAPAVLRFLDGALLVFILAELIHTIRTVMRENVLRMEPFLIVGMVAAIRRILVITGEAREHVGQAGFHDLLLEMAVLLGVVLGLGGTVFLVRHTERSEPHPAPRPQDTPE